MDLRNMDYNLYDLNETTSSARSQQHNTTQYYNETKFKKNSIKINNDINQVLNSVGIFFMYLNLMGCNVVSFFGMLRKCGTAVILTAVFVKVFKLGPRE